MPQNCSSVYASKSLYPSFICSTPIYMLSFIFSVFSLFIISLPFRVSLPFWYVLPLLYNLPLYVYSPPFWHLCQRVYTFLKYLSKMLLWSTIICLRVASQLSNSISRDLSWMAVSAAKWTKPSKVERLGSFFSSVLA